MFSDPEPFFEFFLNIVIPFLNSFGIIFDINLGNLRLDGYVIELDFAGDVYIEDNWNLFMIFMIFRIF